MRGSAALTSLAVLLLVGCGPAPQFGAEIDPVDARDVAVAAPDDAWHGVVTRVIDGDTVWVEVAEARDHELTIGEERKLRLLRIDTPEVGRDDELSECLADQATQVLRNLAPEGSTLRLAYDVEHQDRFGRDLVHAWTSEGVWVNGAMLSGGYANVLTIPPNVEHTEAVLLAERLARENGLGLWAPDACP